MIIFDIILNDLIEIIKHTLENELISVYLYGSAVHGDFNE
jgi:predicted nucleotidyltransferase